MFSSRSRDRARRDDGGRGARHGGDHGRTAADIRCQSSVGPPAHCSRGLPRRSGLPRSPSVRPGQRATLNL